jgi:hypothetical protein
MAMLGHPMLSILVGTKMPLSGMLGGRCVSVSVPVGLVWQHWVFWPTRTLACSMVCLRKQSKMYAIAGDDDDVYGRRSPPMGQWPFRVFVLKIVPL